MGIISWPGVHFDQSGQSKAVLTLNVVQGTGYNTFDKFPLDHSLLDIGYTYINCDVWVTS